MLVRDHREESTPRGDVDTSPPDTPPANKPLEPGAGVVDPDARHWTITDMPGRLREPDPWRDRARHAHTPNPARAHLGS